jgi:hypothetical protein
VVQVINEILCIFIKILRVLTPCVRINNNIIQLSDGFGLDDEMNKSGER